MIRDLTRCSEQTENKVMKQADLRIHRTVARLPFADHMNRFITGDRAPCSAEGAKMLTCAKPTFDGPVVLFQDIIEVLYRTVLTILLKGAFGFEPCDRQRITSVLVGIDYAGREMVLSAQGFRQKALSRCCVAFSRQKKVDRRTAGVHSPVQIYPLALDADVSLIHAPGVVGRFQPPT